LDRNDLARPIVDGKLVIPSEVVDRKEESDDEIIDLAKDIKNERNE